MGGMVMSPRRQIAVAGVLFTLPSLVLLTVFVLVPVAGSLWISLHDWSLTNQLHPFIGMKNYADLVQDKRFWSDLKNTAYYTLGTAPVSAALALLLAVAVDRPLRGVKLFRSVYFMPAVTSMAVVSMIFLFLLDPDIGMITYFTKMIGLGANGWLRDPDWAMPGVVLVGIWKNVGFYMVIFLAGLQGISPTYYEAAEIDGAGSWKRFWHITVPLLMPTLAFVLIIAMIASFQVFDQVYVMTQGGPLFRTETLVQYIYMQGFQFFKLGYSAALGIVLLVLILVLTLIQMRYFRSGLSTD